MWNTLAIARRELSSYYTSFIAYIITAAFLAVNGIFFAVSIESSQSATTDQWFQTMYVIMLLMAPALTMRLLSEEQRSGTMELLLTSPVRDSEIVAGKFLAGFGFLIVMVALTVFYPIMLMIIGNPDKGPLLTGYVGAILFGGAAISIGLFTSSLTSNQIVAAVLSFAILLILWIVDTVFANFGGVVSDFFSYFGVFNHTGDLSRGVIDTKDVIYFLSLIIAGLFLTQRSIETRRWR